MTPSGRGWWAAGAKAFSTGRGTPVARTSAPERVRLRNPRLRERAESSGPHRRAAPARAHPLMAGLAAGFRGARFPKTPVSSRLGGTLTGTGRKSETCVVGQGVPGSGRERARGVSAVTQTEVLLGVPDGPPSHAQPQLRLREVLVASWRIAAPAQGWLLVAGLLACLLLLAGEALSAANAPSWAAGALWVVEQTAWAIASSVLTVFACLRARSESTTPWQAARVVGARLPSLLATHVDQLGAFVLCALVGGLPAAVPAVLFYCAPLPAILEGKRARAALGRSRQLVRGHHGLVVLLLGFERFPALLTLFSSTSRESGFPRAVWGVGAAMHFVASCLLAAALYEGLLRVERTRLVQGVGGPVLVKTWKLLACMAAVGLAVCLAVFALIRLESSSLS